MASALPYRATTATGVVRDISFPLHDETGSPIVVDQILSTVLSTIDREVALQKTGGQTPSNGDVLQAVAMALAIRADMIEAPADATHGLARDLLETALTAVRSAERREPPAGHA